MAKKGEHKKTKPNTPTSKLSPMGQWRRKNSERYQSWRKKYKQTNKSNSRNKARRLLVKSGRKMACTKCGSVSNLEVHHKDSNIYNNGLGNLEWRCAKCNPRGKK